MKKVLFNILLLISLLGCTDKTDENGFYIEGKNKGIHKETKLQYDKNGYNKLGYNKRGFDKLGNYNPKYDIITYYDNGFNKNGWSYDGINKETNSKYDKSGYNEKGFDKDGLNKDGFDKDGFDKNGWSKNGINKKTNSYYDENGYNKGGFTRYGLDTTNTFGKNKFYNYKFKENKYVAEKGYWFDSSYYIIQHNLLIELKKMFKEHEYYMKYLKKDDFETSKSFEERKNSLIKKSSRNIKEIQSEYYILYPYSDVKGKYDADNEEWNFEEIYNNIYTGSSNTVKIKNMPIEVKAKLKMEIGQAKMKKEVNARIRFLVTDTDYDFKKNQYCVKVVAYQVYIGFGLGQRMILEGYID